jgi:hypothetical protein
MRLRALPPLALALALAVPLACARGTATPEDHVRAVLDALVEGARSRDAAALREHVSEAYADGRGNDKRELVALATFHFLRNSSLHLLTRVRGVELPAPGEARAQVAVALAGRPISGPAALPGLRAEVYRFDFALREEDGVWRVTRADWEPGSLLDF